MTFSNLSAQTTSKAPSAPRSETFIALAALAGFPYIDSIPHALTDVSRRAPNREREQRNQAWAPPSDLCLRCSGLLVPNYTASLEWDLTGRPMTLWRCVNCGDCVDSEILANRWKSPVPAHQTAG